MSQTDNYDATGVEYFQIPEFRFISGEVNPVRIAYRSYNPSSKKIVLRTDTSLVPTSFGSRINNSLGFTRTALADYHVIVVAMLGNGESSAPSNDPTSPKTVDYRDCINSQYQLVTDLFGATSLEAVISTSMGGQQAYYWAVMHGSSPDPFVKRIGVIVSSARTSGHCISFLEGPKAALLDSKDYVPRVRGEACTRGIASGVRAFGKAYCAWLTSAAWYREGLWVMLGYKTLEDYLESAHGADVFNSWYPEDLLCLLRMWQNGNIAHASRSGNFEQALRDIEARVLLMPCKTDQYCPAEDNIIEIKFIKHGELRIIDSVWGHIASGGLSEADVAWMDSRIAEFMS